MSDISMAQFKSMLIWRADAGSLQEILESTAFLGLADTELLPALIVGLFPINTRFDTLDGKASLLLSKSGQRLRDTIATFAGQTPFILPVFSNERFSPGIGKHIQRAIDTGAQWVHFKTTLSVSGRTLVHQDQPTPFNSAVSGGWAATHPDEACAFFKDHESFPASPRAMALNGVTAHIDDERCALEARLYRGERISAQELLPHIGRSHFALVAYIRKQMEDGNEAELGEMPFSIFERVAEDLDSLPVCYTHIAELERMTVSEDWVALEQAARRAAQVHGNTSPGRAARRYLTAALANRGHLEHALSEIKTLIAEDPANPGTQYLVGCLLTQAGKAAEGAKMLHILAERTKHDLQVFKALTRAQIQAGALEEAAQSMTYILNVFDYDPRMLQVMLNLCYRLGDMQRLTKYSRYIQPYPPLPAQSAEKEWRIVSALIHNMKQTHWVVDVGANEGDVSKYLLDWGHRVLSVEPDDTLYPLIEEKTAPYGERFCLCRCAASSEPGEGSLIIGNARGFNTLETQVRDTLPFRFDKMQGKKSVHLARLEDLFHEKGISDISLLKLDVEGHELAALKGIDWARLTRIPYVFVELEKRLMRQTRAMMFYLFAAGFHHGLVFQHDPSAPRFFSLWKLEADDNLDLKPELGPYANVILAREPLFAFDEAFFSPTEHALSSVQLQRRLAQ